MEMGSGSNSDNEEKKNAERMNEKAKGKKPVESGTEPPNMETITEKTKVMALDDAKTLKAKGKGVATGSGSGSKGSREKQKENVVKSSYSLRSASITSYSLRSASKDVKPKVELAAPGEKRKAGERRRDFLLSRQACKKFKTARSKDDHDKDGKGNAAGGRTTRSRSQKGKVNSI